MTIGLIGIALLAYFQLKHPFKNVFRGLIGCFDGKSKLSTTPLLHNYIAWDAVYEEFKQNAAMKLGGKIVCEDLHVFAGNEMGYTVCVEEGENIDSESHVLKVGHRATHIFKFEHGEWKLVHHHTEISPLLIERIPQEKVSKPLS